MFEKIIIRRSENGPVITLGELAEALLFYQNVHILLDNGSLRGLLSDLGHENFLHLLERPNISATYCDDMLGTYTQQKGIFTAHNFIAFSFAGNQESGTTSSVSKKLRLLLNRDGLLPKQTSKFVDAFLERVPVKKLESDHFIKGGITAVAKKDLLDKDYVFASASHLFSSLTGESAPRDLEFSMHFHEGLFYVSTNIDYSRITKIVKLRDANAGDVTQATFLNDILMACGDTILSAHYGGELYTSSITSQIIRLRNQNLLRRIGNNKSEILNFTEIVSDGRSVREVINNKERSFEKFLELLDKADRFKKWISSVNPDEKLVKEYFKEISNEPAVSTFPSKVIRYVIGAVAGAVSPGTGLALSAADTFLVDKYLKGWRPNHFVNGQLKPFLKSD